MNKDERIAQLEDEVRTLKAQLGQTNVGDLSSGEELKKRRDTLETFDKMPNGAIYRSVRDMRTGILGFDYLSSTWEKILGVSAEDSFSNANNVFKNGHPEDLLPMMQLINKSLEPLLNFEIEVRYRHPVTKKEIWLQISSYPRREGDYIYADGFIFDITNRKEAELKLEFERERLHSVGNNLPDVTLFQFVGDTQTHQWHLSYVSDTWEAVTEIPADVALNDINTVFAVIHPDDLPTLMETIDNSARTLNNFNVEARLITRGRTRWLQIASRPRREGTTIVADGLMLDITHRKKTERELELERNRLQLLADNIPGGSLFQFVRHSKTRQMRMSYASATWEAVTGVAADAAMNDITKIFSSIAPDDFLSFLKAIDQSAQTMSDFNIEIRGQYRRWLHIVSRPRREDEWIIWDGIIFDVTERKKIEAEVTKYHEKLEQLVRERTDELTATNEELAASNEELTSINDELERYRTHLEEMVEKKTEELVIAKNKAEEADSLKSTFLANMSHEIRTPLNGIVGMLHFIETDPDLTFDQRKEYIGIIKNSSSHLMNLVNDIIDVSKIEAQQMKIIPIPVKINELMYELQKFFETYLQSVGKEHIRMVLKKSGLIEGCHILVDPVRLRQVLNNLIGNAIKFTENGYIRFGYRQSAPCQLEFVVEDTGIGLSPGQQEVIFERFRQVENGNNRQYGGTGLGLTISRSLVQLMGGNMWVKSTEGAGSSFYFTIEYLPVEN